MKRRDLISYLTERGCVLLREGRKHSVYMNQENHTTSTVPRHTEINSFLARKICNDLNIKVWGRAK